MRRIIIIVLLSFIVAGCSTEQIQALGQSMEVLGETQQRQLDRQYYGRPPTIITHPRNPNYWQEEYYREKMQYKSPLDKLSEKYRYKP